MANLSKEKREKILSYLNKLKEKNNDDETIREINEIENFINEKKYGLIWEKHSERIDEILENNILVFKEDETKKIKSIDSNDYNFLLEGDNLHSLKLLEKTHKSKIDVIYIDPPYNTGNNDFIYNDNFVDKNDSYSHSKWLSFMEKRLKIARELLSDEGVIFISIDDNEQAQLKLLCDYIFDEINFIGTFVINVAPNGRDYGAIAKQHEYCLMYSKNIDKVHYNKIKVYDKNFKYMDSIGYFNIHPLYNSNVAFTPENRPNLYYPFYVLNYKDENGFYKISLDKNSGGIEIFPPLSIKDNIQFVWRWGKDKSEENLNKEIVGHKIKNEYRIVQKMRNDSKIIRSLLLENDYITRKGTSELEKILNKKSFGYPKAISLIKILLTSVIKKDSIILDFFAGSGTTGHAVVQLNKEDGGNRKYILCTNNENNICTDVTYQRLKNIQQELSHNLKYFKTYFISKTQTNNIEILLLNHIKELIELEYGIEIDNKNYIIINDEDYLNNNINNFNNYSKLFIYPDILLSSYIQKIIQEKNIEIIYIPNKYYDNDLEELGVF